MIRSDFNHGGTVYIPKRLVEENADYYAEAELEPFDINYLKTTLGLEDEDAKEEFDSFGFTEPMMCLEVCHYEIVEPATLEWFEAFTHEQTARYHNVRYEDCHEYSRWCDG